MLTIGSLFSGIGGLELGLAWAGLGPVLWQVEIDGYCNRVLERHWPDAKRHGDIFNLKGGELERVGLVCGGWPCQPFSVAGKQRGKEDDRYLWPEMARIVGEVRPAWFIGENVPPVIGMGLDETLSDLEGLGYSAVTLGVPACAVGAPHRRDRVWIIAHTHNNGDSRKSIATDTDSKYSQEYKRGNKLQQAGRERASGWSVYEPMWEENWIEVATRFCRVDDGISNRVDRLKCLGNAVVPQVMEMIGRFIMEFEKEKAADPA